VTRRAALALGVAAIALAASWRFAGPATPPLYDGFQSVAPYLYYCIPAGYHQSKAVTAKTQQLTVTAGQIEGGGAFVATDEPPVAQAQVLIGGGSLVLPAGATEITLVITPVAPPATLPSDGALDGNVYTVAVTSGGQPATLASGQQWTLVLRGEPNKPTAVLEQFDGGAWHRALINQPVGQADVYAGNFASFGTFGLVIPGPAGTAQPCRMFDQVASSSSSSSASGGGGDSAGSGLLPILAVVGGLVIVGAGIVAVRARR
jgi:hypothetical protein